MAIEITEANIRYVENGEAHEETTYNRPIQDVVSESNQAFADIEQALADANTNAIVYAIALG